MAAQPKHASNPAPGADLPSPRNPHYDPSDDHAPQQSLSPEEASELKAMRDEIASLREALAQKADSVQAQQAALPADMPLGPSGLPAGMYPERDEYPEARTFPRGTDVSEVLEHDRLVAEKRALARISAGLPAVDPPLPKGAVTATADEFFAPKS